MNDTLRCLFHRLWRQYVYSVSVAGYLTKILFLIWGLFCLAVTWGIFRDALRFFVGCVIIKEAP